MEISDQAIERIRFNDQGLVPAIVQDAEDGSVLMMAWMNAASIRDTLRTGRTHFYSRSRRKYWMKGESSGHVQEVVSMHLDCDGDTLLVKARQVGAACHEGYRSCFFRAVAGDGRWQTTDERLVDPEQVYKK
jgi:phosphoribosyl-AMP cyclohydrolase